MKTTEEFFLHLTEEELLTVSDNSNTKEENLLLDLGLVCRFFSNKEEFKLADMEYLEQITNEKMVFTHVLETIDGRVVVISS